MSILWYAIIGVIVIVIALLIAQYMKKKGKGGEGAEKTTGETPQAEAPQEPAGQDEVVTPPSNSSVDNNENDQQGSPGI